MSCQCRIYIKNNKSLNLLCFYYFTHECIYINNYKTSNVNKNIKNENSKKILFR